MMTVFLSRAADADVPALVAATTGHGLERLGAAYRQASAWLLGADSTGRGEAYRLARIQIESVAEVAAQHVRSVGDVAGAEAARRLIARGVAQVEADGRARVADLDALWREVAGRAAVPAPGPATAIERRLATLRPALAAGPREFLQGRGRVAGVPGLHNLMAFEILNAVNGQRTAWDIYRLASSEARAAGPAYYGVVTPERVEQYLGNLARAGLIRM